MTTVSVVIPTRNRARLLATTLHSVLWQRDVDLEVIVVEDASTDQTAEVVAALRDPRVTLVRRETPQGPSSARNEGAARAGGEWLAFVDDDDLWAPDKLAAQVAEAGRAGVDWVYAGAVTIGDALEVVAVAPLPAREAVAAAVRRYNAIPGGGSNVIVRRALFDARGGFDERFPPCEDWELWMRLAEAGTPGSVARPLVGYRLHGGSSSLDVDRIMRAARRIEQVHATSIDWGRLHRWLAESCLRVGRRPQAVAHLVRAAGHGQARGVLSDLLAIARRRVGSGGPPAEGNEEWVREASAWLGDLRARRASEGEDRGDPGDRGSR